MELKDIFTNKDIVLVGNGENATGYGSFIDSFECVVRFNNSIAFGIKDYDVGKKTDVWIYAMSQLKVCQEIWKRRKVNPIHIVRYGANRVGFTKKPQFLIPQTYSKNVRKTLGLPNGKMPSTGIVALHFLLQFCKAKSITLVGFDGFKTKDYYSDNLPHPSHNGDLEKEFLLKLKDKITVYK